MAYSQVLFRAAAYFTGAISGSGKNESTFKTSTFSSTAKNDGFTDAISGTTACPIVLGV